MVTIQHCTLHENITNGIKQAKSLSRSILVSTSIKLDLKIDSVTFYKNGSKRKGERFYWSQPSGDFVIVGIGNAYKLQSNNRNDFERFQQEWMEMTRSSVLVPTERNIGIGPVGFCAFSFDPLHEKTELWSAFPMSQLVLPQYMLTVSKNEYWLTINTVVNEQTNADELADCLRKEQANLLENADRTYISSNHQTMCTKEIVKNEWLCAIDQITKQICAKEVEKVVLARQIRVKSSSAAYVAEDVLDRLRKEQVLSYIFAIENGEDCFIGASPERLVKKEGKVAFSSCLAGSIRRGKNKWEDQQLGQELLHDEKNLHEHEVVVRAITSAFEKSCDSVEVPKKPVLYTARDIQHLHTPVIGNVKEGESVLSLVEKLHPTPALGGYPRKEALAKIREVEQMDRGWYAGPIGWLDCHGNGEFAVAIRSGLLQGKEASLFAGCGIVGDSDPMEEYMETKIKLKPMLSALGGRFDEGE